MNDAARSQKAPKLDVTATATKDEYDRNFWLRESPKFAKPHFRLEKAARVINALAGDRECTLLDVGCGPSALMRLLRPNIHYFGIDMAIPVPAPNLREINILEEPIAFDDKQFDIVTAQGLFEYLSDQQGHKLNEMARLLGRNGTFVTTYTNFSHRKRDVYAAFSNVQPLAGFRKSLERDFIVHKAYPVSHNWQHGQPVRPAVQSPQYEPQCRHPPGQPGLRCRVLLHMLAALSATTKHDKSWPPTPGHSGN